MGRLLARLAATLALCASAFAAHAQSSCSIPGGDGPSTLSSYPNAIYIPSGTASAGSTSLSLASRRTTGGAPADDIRAGDLLLIVQAQDASFDSSNTSSYGGTSTGSGYTSLGNAGYYEYVTVSASLVGTISGAGTVPLASPLLNTYYQSGATGSSGQRRYQVLRVPQYSTVTLSGTITAPVWDGFSGGIIALEAAGALNWGGATLDASARGFRGGGGQCSNANGTGTAMTWQEYRNSFGTGAVNLAGTGNVPNGAKGEGVAGAPILVFIPTTPNNGNAAGTVRWMCSTGETGTACPTQDGSTAGYPGGSFGRGAPGNGGGGSTDGNPTANDQNTGGAGGGNYSAGGHGGYGWTPGTPPGQDGGGFGGAAVPGSPSRIFFGGGGGSATSNNCTGTPGFGAAGSGASGGGIVFVRVGSVSGSGTINVQGGSANSTLGNDASGGGGAGGTALVFVNNSGGATGATINASGGNGGSNTGGGAPHGPGGGGSGGFVVLSGSASFNVNGGIGGTTATSPTSTFDYGATASAGGVQYVGLTASQIPGAGASPACYPQITVTKTTSTPNVAQGGIATWTITATNAAGRGTARTARLTDVLPATPNFTFAATNNILLGGGATRPVILDPTAAATTPIWGDFDIPGGGTVSIDFNVNVLAATPPATYQNPATIDYLDPTRTGGATRVTPGGAHQSGGTIAAGSNYVATSTTNEDVTVRAPVALAKSFAPTSITDNGVTTLTILFTNPNATALANAAITDNYPAGMENAAVPAANTTCGGTVTAVAGASTFTLANATIPASPATCQVTVNVTATVAQAYTNTLPPGALTDTQNVSNANASATLLARPRVTKSFAPIAVPANTDSTLTISIVNPNAATALTGVQLTDAFPAGLVATSGTVTYGPGCTTFTNAAFGAGASTFTITGGTIAGGATCAVSFAVRAAANGSYANTTSGATSTQTPQAGNASNTANLGVGVVNISKAFAPATIRTGQTSTITFTLVNPTNVVQTSAAFADSLVNMSVANAAVGGTCVGTTPATLSLGATSLSFSGITVPAGVPTGSCSVTVVVTSSTVGTQNNTSSGVSTALLPQGPTSNTAPLTVIGPPSITKSFSPSAIGPGTNSTLTFTLNNPNSVALTGLNFTDTYPLAPGALVNATPIVIGGSCTGVTSTAVAGGGTFNVSVGNFPAGSACTITVPVTATVPGTYNNTTSAVTTAEAAASAPSNTAQLTVLAAPTIAKSFTPATIGAGGTSTVTFTLTNPNASALTNARFTDTFTNMSIGAAGVGGTCGGVFGVPTPAIGDAFVDLRVPTLGPGVSCTVTVAVTSSTVGVQPNVASGVTTTETPTAGAASNSATLTVLATPTIAKSFAPGQIQTGGTSTITFTLANPNASALNLVTFTDTLANMTVASTTTGGTCTGVTFPVTALTVGGTVIAPRLASLAGGASCTLTVQVTSSVVSPAAGHVNTTTGVSSTETTTPGATASANLKVLGAPTIVKSFSPSTVAANNPTTMTFTITNPNPVPLTGGLFTDTFPVGLAIRNVTQSFVGAGRGTCPAAIPAGMVAGSPPPTAPTFTMNAVQVPANSSCTITIDMVATASGTYNNTTSGMTTTQTPIAGPASNTAVLQVNQGPTLAKTFVTNPIPVGANTIMRFTVTNPNASVALTNVAFTDALTNMTVNSATMAGTSTCTGVTFSPALSVGGTAVNPTLASLAGGASCTIDITVTSTVVSPSTGHVNTTGAPTSFESPSGNTAASAVLYVAAPPTVTKNFAPGGVVNNTTNGTVTLVLSNPNPSALTAVTITDVFPAGMAARVTGAAPTLTGCGAGTLTDSGGGALGDLDVGVRLNGATIAANGTCTITFAVRAAVGTYTNTTSLFTGQYTGGALPAITLTGNNASDNFAVGQATISKAFGAATLAVNGTTTLTLTVINNSGGNFTGTLNFLDTFPAGLVVHTTPGFANTCGGAVNSGNTSGNTSVQITGGTVNNAATCTVTVTVRATASGTLSNTVTATAPAAINGRTDTAVLTVLDPPTVTKSFSPSTLNAAGNSTLTITLGNTNAVAITGAAFTDLYPAAPGQMTVANTTVVNTCGGTIDENDAADGDNTYEVNDRSVRLTGGTIPPGGCTITVTVAVPATPGSYTNTIAVGGLTSTNAGASTVPGSAVLTVTGATLTKTFSPASVGLGTNATVVFTISKTAAVATQSGLGFTDTLPSGLTVAATPNILTNCPAGGAFAAPGFSVTAAGSSIAVTGASINVGVATCQVQVNVTPTQAITTCPVAANTNGAANISALAGGIQNGVISQCLSVTTAIPAFTKAFSPTTIATGGIANLIFTVTQPAGNGTQTFSFNDTLPAGLVIQSATVTGSCTGGSVTAPAGGNTITVSGRQISGTTCDIIVPVTTAPAPTVGACPGTPPNTNGAAQISGASNVTSSVTDQCLTVTAAPPSLAKAFSPASIPQGGVSTLTFTVTNGAGNPAQASFGFTDTFPLGLVVAGVPNTSTTCGSASITANAGAGLVTIAGASLALGQASCIVRVDVTAAAANTYTNATANIGAVTGGLDTTGISVPLTVYASAALTKVFNPLAIAPGQVSLLTFTITNGAGNPAQAGLAFTDVLPSNVVVAPAPNVQTNCPAGAGFGAPGGGMTVGASAGGGSISVAGAAINAGVASCQVRVNVTSATAGTYPNTSANVNGLAGGLTAGGVSSTLSVSTASLGKAFNPLSIGAGGVSQLTFTVTNGAGNPAQSGLAFTDNLPSGLVVATPNGLVNGCGGSVTAVAASTSVALSAGTLASAAASCTIQVNVTAASPAAYSNTSGNITGSAGLDVSGVNATLTVTRATLTKSFTGANLAIGGTTTIAFTITNSAGNPAQSGIGFTDTLPAGLAVSGAGSAQTNCPAGGALGAIPGGMTVTAGGSSIVVSGAALNLTVASCEVRVTITPSATPTVGACPQANNTNGLANVSALANVINGVTSQCIPVFAAPQVAKAFGASDIALNGTTTLTLTITNPAGNAGALTGLAVSDAFPAGLQVAATPGLANTCGGTVSPGATAGDNTLTLAGGASLAAGASCQVQVNVTATTVGAKNNTTGNVSATGPVAITGNTASATLTVSAPPTVTKSFNPTSIAAGGTSVLSLTVTNPAGNPAAITTVQLPDTFPAGVTLANTTFTFTPAACGTATRTTGAASVAGDNNIRLNVATLAAGSSCQLQANVTSSTVGAANNTTTAVTAAGPAALTGGTASATLTVLAAPTVAKSFGTASLASGGNTSLTVTIGNTNASAITLTSAFIDTFPAGMTIGTAGNTGTCAGVTATAGAASFSVASATSIPAGGCTVIVNVTTSTPGAATNTIAIGDLQTSAGPNAAAASATLNVFGVPTVAKSFNPTSIASGGTSVLSLTVTNPAANPAAITTVQLPDTFPAGVTLSNIAFTFTPLACGTATRTTGAASVAGDNNVRLNVATLAPGASCQLQANVTSSTVGAAINTTTAVTAAGPAALTGGTANATLTVLAAPTLAKSFGAASIASGGNIGLTVTIGNTNASAITLTSALTDTFPAGMTIGTAGNTGTCTGVTATAGANNFSVASATSIPAGGCTVIVNVTTSTPGAAINTLAAGSLQTSAGNNAAPATATLNVFGAPTVAKSFNPTSIAAGGTSVLSLTVTNPAANPAAITTVQLPDTFPAGVTLANIAFTFTPLACGTATRTTGVASVAGDNNVRLNVASLAAGASCQLQANVTSSTVGVASNTTTAVTATGPVALTGGTANATLTVLAAPTVTKAFGTTNLASGGNTSLTVTVGNTNAAAITLTAALTDTFPAGMTIGTAGNTGTCTGVTANAGANNFSIANATSIPAGGCTVIVNVTTSTPGASTNTIAAGSLQTSAGNNAAPASATLNVFGAPTVAKSFNPTSIAAGGTSVLSLTVTNPAANPAAVTTIQLPDTFPAGVTLANTAFTFTPLACGTATTTAGAASAAGDNNVRLNVATLAANASCQLQANVTSSTVGAASNTTTVVTATGPVALTGGTANATLTVLAAPTVAKVFGVAGIASGGNISLTVTIGNTNAAAITLTSAFTDTFPAGMTIGTAGNTGTCTGVTATAGANNFSIANATSIPAGGCTVIVNVTSSTPGAATNTIAAGALQTSAGNNAAPASATLNVFGAPTVAKSFNPTSIAAGGTSVLSLTVTNPAANPAAITTVQLPDTFPAGVTLSNIVFTFTPLACGTATRTTGAASVAGDNNIRLNVATLAAGASCQLQATVTSSTVGAAINTTTAVTATGPVALTGGTATATLTVLAAPTVAKSFGAASLASGGNTSLTVTIANTNAAAITLSSALTDNFPAGMTIGTAGNTGTCTGVTATAGANNFSIASATSIPAGGCTVIVNVTSSTPGAATNTIAAGDLQTSAGNNPAPASATLNVFGAPTVAKSFNPTSIAAGGTSVLSLTLTNPASNPAAITTVQLPDTFPAGVTLSNIAFTFTPLACGTATRTTGAASVAGDNNVRLNVASLAAGASCQLQANVTSSTVGVANNTTTAVTAAGPAALTGGTANATLTVLAAPTLTKSFGVASLASGGNTSLTVTIGNTNAAAITLSSALTDTFPGGMTIGAAGNTGTCTGVTATAGAGSFTVANATSIPSGGCTVIVNVTSSTPGASTNTIAAGSLQTSAGNNAAPASATLNVFGAPTVAKSFNPTSIAAGGTSVLSLTVTNPGANPAALTTIQLPDTFPAGVTLSNVVFTFTPAACGTATTTAGAASASGDNNIRLNVATLAAGASCQLQANVTSSTVGVASNTTTAVTATGPVALTGGTANATLTVLSAPTLAKSFGVASIASGANTSLTVTIGNTNGAAVTLTSAFTDTFPAGMTIGTAGNTGTCTGVTATAGANNFTIANATSIPAGGCTVIVNVTSSTPGASTNTIAAGSLQTSAGNNAAPASATLNVFGVPTVAKSFNPTSIAAGGTSVLSLTVTNPAGNPAAITTVQLPDTFPAGVTLSNTTFTFTPLACGTATRTTGVASAAGDNNIRLNVATLGIGASCQLQANVTSSTVGAASNTTTAVTAAGPAALTGGTANAILTVLTGPTVTKAFGAAGIASGGNTSLTVTIGNTNAAAITLSSALTDNFPAGMTIGTAGNTGTCAGVTATAGAASFSIANATSIPAGGCTVIVNVTSSTPGAATNTIAIGDLQTSAGPNAAPASATLNVFGAPTVAKSFNPTSIAAGGTSVLSLTVTNPAGNPAAITTVQLPDTFPAGVTLANITFTFTPAACGTATRTTGAASAAGDNNVRLNVASLAAGASCQLQANVTSSTVGTVANTTTAVTAAGPVALTGGTATANLTVLAGPVLGKSFGTGSLASGGNTSLTVTLGNGNAGAITLTAALTDTFPAGMTLAAGGSTGTCAGVTATAGTGSFTVASGTSIPAGGCTVIVSVTSSTPGAATNTLAAGSLQTSAGNNAAPATATLNVFGAPTVAKSFSPTSIAAGGTSVLSLTVTNPAANPAAITTVQLPDTFPAGVTLSNIAFTFTPLACGTATRTTGAASVAGDNNIRLNVATLAAGASCQLQATVTSSTVGAASNTTTAVTATGPVALTGGTASGTLTVLAGPTVTKSFGAADIASGGNTSLTVTIGNTNAASITLSAALTDTFPAGMTIGTAGNTGTCTGVTATAGAGSFTVANATSIPAGGCTVIVNVTSSTPGASTNTIAAGSLQTSAGNNAAPASATLNVYGAPTVTKTFNPTSIAAGGTSVLSLTVTNPGANPAAITTVQLPDTFPAGVTLSNIAFTFTPLACGTATRTTGAASVAGDNNIRLNVASLAPGTSCQLQANVTSSTVGAASNTTSAVTATGPVALTGGTATATLTVLSGPTLAKAFGATDIASGGNTSLTVTIGNANAGAITLASAFTDTFPAGMTIGTAGNTGTCTGVTATAGAGSFTVANATSIPSGGCTVIVNVTSSTPGAAVNTLAAGSLQTSAGNNAAPATATLNVYGAPTVTKTFNPTSIAAGGTSVLSLTVTNPGANPAAITGMQLPDTFPAGVTLSNIAFTFTPAACGTATRTTGAASVAGDNNVRLNVATLAAGASCQLQANVTSSTVGPALNTTTAVTATGPAALTGGTATATLTVLAGPTLAKSFAVASLAAGGNTDLTVTLGNANAGAITLTAALTDTFPAGMTINTAGNTGTCTGVTATAGAGSFTVANATSIPSGGCTVIVNVTSSTPGAATNTLAAGSLQTSAGNNAAPASATLNVFGAPTVTKTFNPTTIAAGGTSVLALTVTNPAANPAAITTVQLPDTFPAGVTLANVTFTFTPAACGTATRTTGAASAAGDNNVRLNVASLAAGASCQLQANVTSSTIGVASNTTTAVTATGPVALTGGTATATLTVQSAPTLAKSFSPAGIASGGSSTLTVTIGNTNAGAITLTAALTDTFPAGMTIGTAGNTGTCTGVTATAGANNFSVANATSIPAGGCTVIVNVTSSTPGAAVNTLAAGSLQTSAGNNAAPATATLNVFGAPTIAKSFASPIGPNGVSQLTFTVTNPAANPAPLTGVAFTDTFPTTPGAMVVAATTGASTTGCGAPTFAPVAGAASIAFSGGTIATGTPCTVTVNVTAPTVGTYNNTSSAVSATGPVALSGGTASASLVVAQSSLDKAFAPTTIAAGGTSTLTFTIANAAGNAAQSGIGFTDNLPGNVRVAAVPNVTTNCPAGGAFAAPGFAVTAVAGSPSVTIANAAMNAAVASCQVRVDVTANIGGAYTNDATRIAGTANITNAVTPGTLTVTTATPTVTKSFNPATVNANAVSQLTITLTNANSTAATLSAALTDTLPVPVVVATPANASTDCAGAGALVATAGTGTITLPAGRQIPAGSGTTAGSCTITVDVRSASGGVFTNTIAAGALQTSNGNNAAPASAVLTVNAAAPSIAKSFTPPAIAADGTSTVTLTISNPNAFALTGAGFGDTLANMTISGNQNAAGSCAGANTNALTAGQTAVAISGLTIPAAVGVTPGSCTVTFVVTSDVPGVNNNATTGVASSNAPTGAVSNTATLTVTAAAPTIVKSFTPASIAYGATSTVTLTIANTNGGALTGAGFTDTLANMSISGAQTALGTCVGANGNNLTAGQTAVAISGLTIPANSSCTVTFIVTSTTPGVNPNATSGVASAQAPTGAVSNTVNLTVTATAPTIGKTFTPATVISGQASTLRVSITNPNAAAITGVALTDTFPVAPGAGLVRAPTPNASAGVSCGAATVNTTAGSVSISNATIAAGATCTFQVDVVAGNAGVYVNTIAAGALASSAGSNTAPASATLTVTGVADVAVVKSAPATVVTGNAISYTITITNAGPDTAHGTTFSDNVPAQVTGVTGGCVAAGGAACGTVNVAGNNVTSTITALPVGGTITITIGGTVGGVGALANTATVAPPAGTTDPANGNNSSTANTTILAPDLTIAKTHAGNFTVGTNGVYTIAVGNGGTAATSGTVTVTDSLPAGLGFVSATGAGWTCGFVAPTVTCTSAAVIAVAGNAPPITLTVSVASTAVPSVLNFASVAGGGEPAALNGNNQSGDNTIVTSPGVNTFVPDGAQTGMPGTVVFYPHSFTAATAGSVAFTTTNVPSPVVPGWTQLVYLDSDCSGTLSTAEGVTPLTAAVAINAGETICIVVKDNIPPMAPYNARNVITVTSTFNGASTLARTDTTTVGALAGAGLTLAKAVRNVTQGGASGTSNQARPNDVLEYTITYTNTSTSSVSAIVVTDATPAFTTYLAAACTAPLPASLTGCTVTAQPAVNGSGSVVWTLAGSLNSGGSGSVTYTVRVEP